MLCDVAGQAPFQHMLGMPGPLRVAPHSTLILGSPGHQASAVSIPKQLVLHACRPHTPSCMWHTHTHPQCVVAGKQGESDVKK